MLLAELTAFPAVSRKMQDNLAAAEHAARAAELRIVYAAYKNVAQYFAQEGKSRKAVKFFLKCLDIAVTARRPRPRPRPLSRRFFPPSALTAASGPL